MIDGIGTSITAFFPLAGEELEFPTTIRTTHEAFDAYLISMIARTAGGWPESQAAAYGLFLVHLDEEMTVLPGNPDTIDITAKAMKPYRGPYEPFTPPPGEYEWRA